MSRPDPTAARRPCSAPLSLARIALSFALAGAVTSAGPAFAQRSDLERAQADQIAELQRQVAVLVEEVGALKRGDTVPETPEQMESWSGLGPAASKVYGVSRGLSLGGYAEGVYSRQVDDTPGDGSATADFLRAVVYMGYKFNDRILFNSEIEVEHADEIFLELAQLDFLVRPELNFRAGMMLMPIGFMNEVHEPPFRFGTARPEIESQIIPSTWRENGLGIYGNLGESLSYRAYVVNGLRAAGFSSSGLRGGRQKGSRARADDMAFVGRFDFEPSPGLSFGGSFYRGNSGQDELVGGVELPDVGTRLWEVHGQYQRGGLHLRALYTEAELDDAAQLSFIQSDTIAEKLVGGYVEIAYDLMQWLRPGSEATLSPFFRFEYLDPQYEVPDGFAELRNLRRRIFVPGIQFKPHPNVVLTLDYRNFQAFEGDVADEIRFAMGLAF